jgi:hypothetical protein
MERHHLDERLMPQSALGDPYYEERQLFRELQNARNRLAPDDPLHDVYAPAEHGAYTQLFTREHPIIGALSSLVGSAIYTPAKAVGIRQGRSSADPQQMLGGWAGMLSGMGKNIGALGVPDPITYPRMPGVAQRIAEAAKEDGRNPDEAIRDWLILKGAPY